MIPAADDLQAIVHGHLRRPLARHLLFRFDDEAPARAFLAGLAVTLGDSDALPMSEPLVSLGVSHAGLRRLGVGSEILEALDPRFQDGSAPRRMGDHAGTPSDPETWWEGRFATREVHCIVNVHAAADDQLEARTQELCAHAAACGVTELIPRADGTRLDGAHLPGHRKVHFGYTDGISSPRIAWRDDPEPGEVSFRSFVLGYATPERWSAPGRGPAAEFVRGSSYGVFRWIYQDVAAFNRFLRDEGPRLFADLAPEDAQERLAAKLMGRWRDGTPLVLSPDGPDPELADSDDFGYADDPDGVRCPFSAHIRVMNPRDQPLRAMVVEPVPKVLRRGSPYGPPLEGTEDDGRDRGLIGVFLCTDIRRQILTLTMWAEQNDFADVYRGAMRVQDALIGSRAGGADTRFTVPGAPGATALPSFLRTKGTALLLYPGRATLAALAT